MSSGFASQNAGPATKSSSNNNLPAAPLSVQGAGSSSAGIESSRRGGGGSGCAASGARCTQSTPRNNQSARKNHKNHRKPNTPRFEDVVEEQLAMPTSEVPSRRGTSITHLMNWNLRPQFNDYAHPHSRHRSTYRRNPTWGLGSGYHAADKARYVNANYRFIVDPRGDYRSQTLDSDVHLPWDKVLQVLASAKSQTASCPICLSVPVAPRMAKCGHIFCLPCVMRYMASDSEGKSPVADKKPKFKSCPICWDSVYLSDVRPVRWFTGQEGDSLHEGMDVILRLMLRRQGNTLVLPRDGAEAPMNADIPWHFAAEVADYARVMKGTRTYMEDQYKQEIEDLKVMGKEDELMFHEEGEWTKKAIGSIRSMIENLGDIADARPPPTTVKANPVPVRPPLKVNDNPDEVPQMYYMQHAARSGQVTPVVVPEVPTPVEEISKDAQEALPPPPPPAPTTIPDHRHEPQGSYYFYRALPHYYLSPLDIRILKTAFGPYSTFPATILPRVEHISTGHTVDDELRKRAKYLGHLPYGTEVAFLECDWTDVVPPAILERFKPEIERRRTRKREREAREEKDRVRAEKEEEEGRWAAARLKRRESMSTGAVRFTEDDFVELAIAQSQQEALQAESASVASDGSPPVVPAASPPGPKTVWGTPIVRNLVGDSYDPGPSSSSQHHDDGWMDGWEQDYLVDKEIAAHESLDHRLAKTPGQSPIGGGRAGTKKGKKKKVTLMTNGGRRGA